VESIKIPISYYFQEQINSDPEYQTIMKIMNGELLSKQSTIYKHFKNLVERTNSNEWSIKNLKKHFSKSVPPKTIRNYKTFDNLWDDIQNEDVAFELIEKARKDLLNNIVEGFDDNVKPFIKDKAGEPYFSFQGKHLRKFITDYSTEQINDEKTVREITELASIFDKLVELTVAIPIDGKLSNQNTTARFLNSSDRIMEKAHGNKIFKELKKKGIEISLKKEIFDWNFLTNTNTTNNNLQVNTTLQLTTTLNLVYGDKEEFKAFHAREISDVINEHALKVRGLIDSYLSVGKPSTKN
jgi:hypothetical protein